MAEWRTIPLGSLAANEPGAIAIGPFGSRMKAEIYVPTGVPIIRGTNISSGPSWKGDWVYVPEPFAAEMPNCLTRAGDLVFPHRGSIGEVALVPDDGVTYMISTSLMKFRPDTRQVSAAFLLHFFRAPKGRAEILRYASQVGTPGIGQPLTSLRQFRVELPPLPIQRAIASILGALDEKIELNRRMNETLEAMARAIFQDWFVAFGPTRAKMEGRPPYLAPDLWALFPDRLDAGGKPEGWREVPLDQIADFLNGLALQKYPGTGDDDLPVIKIAELRAGVATGSDRAARSIPAQYVVEDGDVLFSWSGSLLQRVWTGGLGALNQHLFKVTSKQWPKWLHYFWVDHHLPSFQGTAASKATTMGHIQRHHLSEAMTVIGSPGAMRAADALIDPLFQRGVANSLESRTLAATRDLLLPRLMSGELRVTDAENIASEAA